MGKWFRNLLSSANNGLKWVINNPALSTFIVVVAHLLFWDWFVQVDKKCEPLVSNSEIMRNAALVIAGIWGAYGVMIAARRLELQEKREKGQVAERYTHAAEQLDSKSESVRMVAVLGLQKLAKEADDETFFNIIKVFCFYIREKYPVSSTRYVEPRNLPESFNQIIDFLSKVDEKKRYVEGTRIIDLSKTDLSNSSEAFKGKDLRYFNFEGARLFGTHFEEAYLGNASLKNADMQHAFLEGAKGLDTIEGIESVQYPPQEIKEEIERQKAQN